ncbi:MAG TPA: hypothetical protein VN943_05485 [Candidatus Acidoferrum sp.]|nr:hypothetical protein [Candidatus Acidoferrum sp.]
MERPEQNCSLLNDVTRTEVAGIQRLATGKSFVLAMVEADAILAKPPAQINFFVVDQRREVEQANLKIFDEATGFKDAIERGLKRFSELLVLDAQGSEFFVRYNDPAHHGNSSGNCSKVRFEAGELLSAIHRFNKERLKLLAGALGFGEGKKSRLRLWAIVLVLLVVFIRHCDSVEGCRPVEGQGAM